MATLTERFGALATRISGWITDEPPLIAEKHDALGELVMMVAEIEKRLAALEKHSHPPVDLGPALRDEFRRMIEDSEDDTIIALLEKVIER